MLRALFGKKKRSRSKSVADDSITDARVGDVIFIQGMWEDGEDAYLIIEQINRLRSFLGESREAVCVDSTRRVTVEWSEQGELHIAITREQRPMGLSAVGLDYDTLVEWDNFKSLENSIEYNGHIYFYRNSYETLRDRDGDEDGGFYTWEFIRDDDEAAITVVKGEAMPFEVYASEFISPHLVTVYRK